LRRFFVEGKPVATGTHPASEIQYFTTNAPKLFPPVGEPDDGFRLLECDLNTPRRDWIRKPGPNTRGGYNPISIRVWGTATELNGEYLVHLWSPCPLSGTCRVTVPGAGTFEVPVPTPNRYVLLSPKRGFDVELIQ
jgi:hypothetical protein